MMTTTVLTARMVMVLMARRRFTALARVMRRLRLTVRRLAMRPRRHRQHTALVRDLRRHRRRDTVLARARRQAVSRSSKPLCKKALARGLFCVCGYA